jgi:hypothetical protein
MDIEKIDGKRLEIFKKLALKEKEFWDIKNQDKDMSFKQAGNTVKSCLNGILGEFIAKLHIYKNNHPSYILDYGILERQTGKILNKGDIVFDNKKVEVKAVRSYQPHGQILIYHAKKYIEENVDYVYFVDLNEKNNGIYGYVYLIATPQEILKWPLEYNLKNKLCYTCPDWPQ